MNLEKRAEIVEVHIMEFQWISKTLSTVGEKQYESIGAFLDAMSERYGRENLRGLGYNGTDTSIEYVIGLIDGDIEGRKN